MSMAAQPFDMAGLRDALPAAPVQLAQIGGATWAADFLGGQPATTHTPTQAHAQGHAQAQAKARVEQQNRVQIPASAAGMQGGALPWSPVYANYGMAPMAGMAVPVQRHIVHSDQMSWDKEFQSQESLLNASVPVLSEDLPEQQQHPQGVKGEVPADEMARLAAQVIDSVKHEQNPKFQKSEFMQLMRQLRDGEVIVEKDAIVPKDATTTAAMDVKGKGRAVMMHDDVAGLSSSQSHVLPLYQGSEELNAAYVQQAMDPHEAYFRQENADFTEYWNAHYTGPAAHTVSADQERKAWHEMQRDWDAFEVTTTGVKPVVNYQFQTNNPYLLGDSSRTRHHTLHMSRSQREYESVLELEAAVQRDPTNAAAWFELGVKQQENEREAKAIQALQRAIDLDLSHLPSRLALAVSYTNDTHRLGAYDAIREWVLRNPRYEAVVSGTGLATHMRGDFSGLIDVLIRMARSADQQGGGVDADVQVALAVLLNTTEEYAKAVDCFHTALAVRPEDWLLYNRVGATMANNGRAADALEYYLRALELNPAYIRARFNLGISCINLRRYDEAASHILDALVLQDSDGVKDGTGMNDSRGVTSSSLWDSLKTTCLHLQRADLASMCDRRDLDGFRKVFHEV
ncbi:TPR-like protein [Imleria badia]|nr:TPR-like protein [Imleria badia]